MHPPLTIFCPFTRTWAVDEWLENLAAVEHDPALTNICVIIDGDQHLIANTIKRFVEARAYKSFHVKINEDWHPNEVRLAVRRMRVADIHNQSKDLIAKTDGEIIIGLEDDTVFDRLDSFKRLYEPIVISDQIGFVEGVQMGRWGAHIVGVWEADDIFNPKQIKTLLPHPDIKAELLLEPYQEITGGGFYGYATRRDLYLNHEYYTSSSQPWGPDVNFGFYVRQRGYQCLVDWGTLFGHRDFNKVMYPDDARANLCQIIYNKNEANGHWDRSDYEQTRY